jgi:hypothetical protein
MKNKLAIALVSVFVTACGGGGDGGGSASSPAPAPAPSALAAYAGTWEAACDAHERETAIFTLDGAGALVISTKNEYFTNVGCTGAILATETLSANFKAVFAGAVNASVQLAAGAALSAISVDTVNSSAPSLSMQITGPGVVRATKNGQAQWCISYGGGSQTCVNDDGVQPARSARGGLYLKGNQLFSLDASGSTFVVGGIYTRK